MSEHTGTPWEFGQFYYPADGSVGGCEITQVGDVAILAKVILPAYGRSGHGEGKANAEFICLAANTHDELVAALTLTLSGLKSGSVKAKQIVNMSDGDEWQMQSLSEIIEAALAKTQPKEI